jgi:hypothetical protein
VTQPAGGVSLAESAGSLVVAAIERSWCAVRTNWRSGAVPCRELPSRAPHVDGLGAAISVAPSHSFNFDRDGSVARWTKPAGVSAILATVLSLAGVVIGVLAWLRP